MADRLRLHTRGGGVHATGVYRMRFLQSGQYQQR